MDEKLKLLIEKSKEAIAKMSPEELEAMLQQQKESYVRAEMAWPKPRYRWENGVKVYESYSDYCND